MEDKIQITNIELKVGKNKFNLSLKEAHELKDILNETFPEKEIVYIPNQPVYVPIPYRSYDYWKVHYGTSGGTLTMSTTNS